MSPNIDWIIDATNRLTKNTAVLVRSDRRLRMTDKVVVAKDGVVIYVPMEQFGWDRLVRHLKEREMEIDRLTKEIARLDKLLNNPKFVEKSPANVFNDTWERQITAIKELMILEDVDFVELQ